MGIHPQSGTEDRRELTAPTGGRLDAVIAAALTGFSRARIQRLISDGHVSRNGAPVRKSEQVEPGDQLVVVIPPTAHAAPSVDLALPILYQDDDVVAIDKPAGLAVHGAPGEMGPTIAAWFLDNYLADAAAFDVEHPGVVHRLDKDTSGVLLLARTPAAQAHVSAAFEARTSHKTYLAVCDGVPAQPRAVVDAPIGRHPGDRTRMAIVTRGRDSRTDYETLFDQGGRAFVLVRPETGRTHQIRVHLAAVGASVSGDSVYGPRITSAPRQMLHAWQLDVPHPAGGRITITAPLPPDILDAVSAIGASEVALPYTVPTPPRRYEDPGE